MPKKTTKKVAVRVNVSKAIREAIEKLGVDAPAREVSDAVSRMSPDHAEKVKATGKLWDNYVSMQRSRLRGGNKKRRAAGTGTDDTSVSVANLRELIKIGTMLKHPGELSNLFAAISNLGSPRKVQAVAQKLSELQTRYEDLKKVEAFLNDVEALGIRL
jgi:hypothetical protein